MGLQEFTLLVAGVPTAAQLTALFTRCADVTIEYDVARGSSEVSFERDAPTLVGAIVSAVNDLDRIGLVPVRLLDDRDLVTLAQVAGRIGRSLHAVRLWASGRTGPGGFPPPVCLDLDDPLHRWTEVVPWLRDRMGIEQPPPDPVYAAVNLALQLRSIGAHVKDLPAVVDLIRS